MILAGLRPTEERLPGEPLTEERVLAVATTKTERPRPRPAPRG
jgi:hypothetical protein